MFFFFVSRAGLIIRSFLNPFPNKPWFLHVFSTNLLKTQCEKEKLLVTSNFSFSHSVFHPFWQNFIHFHLNFKIGICELFQFGRVENLSFGKGLICHSQILSVGLSKKFTLSLTLPCGFLPSI